MCEIFLRELNPGYVVGKYELARCVGYKVGRVEKLGNCAKVNFGEGGYPWGGSGWGGLCEIFLRELNPGYVVGKYELDTCVG